MADSAVSIRLEPVPAWPDSVQAGLLKSAAYSRGKNEWCLKVSLAGRGFSDHENTFGVSPRARDGFDKQDLFEPPRMAGQGYVYFPHPEWMRGGTEFASDIRAAMDELAMFDVGVAPWSGRDSAVLRLSGTGELNNLYVFIRNGETVEEYDPAKGITLPPSDQKRFLTVIITADRALGKTLPVAFRCGNPYPNPVRNQVRIQYTLPYEWAQDGRLTASSHTVKIAIYDLSGRQIRNLAARRQAAGSYETFWDCKTNSGRLVCAGAYMYTIQAGKNRAMKRITVLR
jgi:hypothetical protein